MSIQIENGEVQMGSLQRGDVFTTVQLETITQQMHGTKEYELGVLQFMNAIELHFLKRETKDDVCVRVLDDHSTVRILTHPEQAEYTRSRSGNIKKRFRKNHRKSQGVDMGKLSSEQQKRHAEFLARTGAEIIALGYASRARQPSKVTKSSVKKLLNMKSPTASVPHPSTQPVERPVAQEPVMQMPASEVGVETPVAAVSSG